MYYESKYTYFCASEPPYTDTIYYKDGNKTVTIIHVDKDWNMSGEVIDPFDQYVSPVEPIWGTLNQEQCERMLLKDMPSPNRTDVKKKYNMDKIDYAMLMYCTRLISMINSYWVAWSENDKAEDYHPRYNEEILKERDSYNIEIDHEPEDDGPSTPYIDLNALSEEHELHYIPGKDEIQLEFSDEEFKSMYEQ